MLVPAGMIDKSLGHSVLGNFAAALIKIEQPIQTQRIFRSNNAVAHRHIGLEGTGGSQPDEFQAGMFGFRCTGIQVDIEQRVQFIYNNINIVRAHSC